MSKDKRILMVDNDIDFVQPIRKLLEVNGYEVIEARNGKEGIEKARSEKPDLILLDVMMTRLSEGFDTSRELRAHVETKNIPIIMTTAINAKVPFGFGPDKTWLPVDRFIEKPISPERLLKEVELTFCPERQKGEEETETE